MSLLPTIIVPARLASHRFPNKLLAEIDGCPLILHTARRLSREVPEFEVFFAVDSQKLADILTGDGHEVILTEPELSSGTDRIAKANDALDREFVINIQADEPLVTRAHVLALAESISKSPYPMCTLATPFSNAKDFHDPNQVKVVLNHNRSALYFSRSPIPFCRDSSADHNFTDLDPTPLKHVGMYAYERDFLKQFSDSCSTKLETTEKLEQLRVLEMGYSILVSIVERDTVGVDLPEDLLKISKLIGN